MFVCVWFAHLLVYLVALLLACAVLTVVLYLCFCSFPKLKCVGAGQQLSWSQVQPPHTSHLSHHKTETLLKAAYSMGICLPGAPATTTDACSDGRDRWL